MFEDQTGIVDHDQQRQKDIAWAAGHFDFAMNMIGIKQGCREALNGKRLVGEERLGGSISAELMNTGRSSVRSSLDPAVGEQHQRSGRLGARPAWLARTAAAP